MKIINILSSNSTGLPPPRCELGQPKPAIACNCYRYLVEQDNWVDSVSNPEGSSIKTYTLR